MSRSLASEPVARLTHRPRSRGLREGVLPFAGAAERLLVHARVEFDDQPAFLGDAEEVSGSSRPRFGVLPACEGLERLDGAVGERDDRLEVRDDLAPLDCPLELERELAAAAQAAVQTRLVERVPAALVALCRVHRDVGVAEQLLGGRRVRGRSRRCRCSRAR